MRYPYKFLDLIENIKNEKFLVVVEGKRDKKVLMELGIENVITLYELINEANLFLNHKKAIILTDNDKKGKKLYKFVRRILESEGIIINDLYRIRFFRYFKTVRIEDLEYRLEDIKFYINYEKEFNKFI